MSGASSRVAPKNGTTSKDVGEQPIDWQNCATGALDRSHWAIRSAQILAVFEDAQRDISRISLRTGIETRAHLESTRKRALRLEKPIRPLYAYALAIYQVPVEPYAPVRRQLLIILREVNRARKAAGLAKIPTEVLVLKRRVVRPFQAGSQFTTNELQIYNAELDTT